MKVSELSGAALNYAVILALFPKAFVDKPSIRAIVVNYPYDKDWKLTGPIIEREEIGVRRNAPCSKGREWEASPSITAKGAGGRWGYGPTPLIAAMRCFVASKLGDEIEIPKELT